MPPHGVVVVVPLVNLSDVNGATQFLAGSHLIEGNLAQEDLKSLDAASTGRIVTLSAQRSSVILFDLRTRHRGGANTGGAARPILYMSYVRDWFRDTFNFRPLPSREWDSLPSHRSRKLLTRIAERTYVRRLEEVVRESGKDPRDLASDLHPKMDELIV